MYRNDFPDMVRKYLIDEMGHTEEDATRIVKAYPKVMVNGMMMCGGNYAAVAMALEMAHERGQDAPFDPDSPKLHD